MLESELRPAEGWRGGVVQRSGMHWLTMFDPASTRDSKGIGTIRRRRSWQTFVLDQLLLETLFSSLIRIWSHNEQNKYRATTFDVYYTTRMHSLQSIHIWTYRQRSPHFNDHWTLSMWHCRLLIRGYSPRLHSIPELTVLLVCLIGIEHCPQIRVSYNVARISLRVSVLVLSLAVDVVRNEAAV